MPPLTNGDTRLSSLFLITEVSSTHYVDSKAKSVHAGHRGAATKIIAKVEDSLMAEDSPSPTALAQLKLSLNKKLDVLDQLDDNILNKITDAEVADEISGSDEFKEGL